ncbi:MAG: DNA polymerase III subunit alpha [Actinobacteria bacterium]|nr:DNA polymerase III subunit alpha [Actinomycetota bacterium]
MSGFVHLHCHSAWSLLDGAIPAEELPHVAAERGFEAVALTDHDALTGAVRFSKACRAAGIKPIFGAELTVQSGAGPWSDAAHVTLLARNEKGYGNLCRLISEAHLGHERGKPLTTFDALADHREGLFLLSGCERGEVARLAAAGAIPKAIETARRWRDVFGDRYRLEVFDHRGYGQRALRDRLLKVARAAGVTPVATNDVHYAGPENAVRHEVLHAIADIVPLSRAHALRANSEYFLKDQTEMRSLFQDAPEAADETLRIADACDFDLDLGSYHFPDIPIPVGETATGLLARRCYEGARRRFGSIRSAVDDRLQNELGVIFVMGFAAYFLLIADIVDHVRLVLGIRCACRGSAAGSLVCYVLGISDVDPIRYDLLFERFMNSRREELPDIDVDVESHRREEVLSYILDTYGREQTAVCCMVDTFRARMAIRDVGKALGMPPEEIDIVAKAFPRIAARQISTAIEHLPELAGTNLDGGQLAQLFELCLGIDGFPRHLALHPSGVILSASTLGRRVPMQESFNGFTMLQADKHDVEDLGLVKLDVLGVRMLSSIAHARDEIARTRGTAVDIDSIPRDDPATFRLIKTSNTLGCFQIESPGQRELLARLQPNRFEDLIVEISLFRPGPVQSDMVSPFLERRHGFQEVCHPHPSLAPVLAETGGVIIYHEQLIRVIAAATGCSLADADYVRRHLDSERPSLPDDPNSRPARRGLDGPRSGVPADNSVGAWFIECALARGYSHREADALWDEVFAFASFGFCKSHAAAFALPTYVSAWLKAHYPAEFLAGILTHDPGMYPRRAIVADARCNGISILPIDVNRSGATYRAEGDLGVRLALTEVRDMSATEIDALVGERAAGPFRSLEDLIRRTGLSRPVLENLVHVGALDSIEPGRKRRELLWRAADLAAGQHMAGDRAGKNQLRLTLDEPIARSLSGLASYDLLEETEAELEVSGIDARRHIMDLYSPLLAEIGCTPASALSGLRNDSETWIAGVKVSTQTPAIRSGQRIIFLTLDDPTGLIDVTVFQRAQARCARTVFHSWLLVIKGVVRKRGGASLIHDMERNVGITVVAIETFDLAELAHDRKDGHSLATSLGRQRRRQAVAGLAVGPRNLEPPSRMWHASGGSAGR